MQSSLKNMVIVLGTITLVASAAVGGIYLLTKEPIETAQEQKINDAIAEVLPEFDNVPATEAIELEIDGSIVNIYPASKDGNAVGYAVETFSKKGFGGLMTLMVGFLPDGTIKDISVISHGETPGLGDKIQKSKSDFAVQFEGKNPASFRLGRCGRHHGIDHFVASLYRCGGTGISRLAGTFAGRVCGRGGRSRFGSHGNPSYRERKSTRRGEVRESHD